MIKKVKLKKREKFNDAKSFLDYLKQDLNIPIHNENKDLKHAKEHF